MVGTCCNEDFLFHHLDHFQFALCLTPGFLHTFLTQRGLRLPKMILIPLSLPTLTYFTLAHGPMKV